MSQVLSRAFARSPRARSFAWARLASLRFWLVPALVRDLCPGGVLVCLVREDDRARAFQLVEHAPDPIRFLVVDQAGECARYPQDLVARTGDDLQVHAVLFVLAGAGRLVAGDTLDRDECPVEDDVGVTCLLASLTALTVTADPHSKLFGAPDPALTATIVGFAFGQTLQN